MKLQNKSLVAIFLAMLGLASCFPQDDNLSGYYEFIHPTGVIVPGGAGTNCSPHWKAMRGLCILDYDAVNKLGLKILKNGDIKFATHLSFFNGHSCGLQGVAEKSDGGWVFEELLSSKDMERMTFANKKAKEAYLRNNNCRLNIFLDEDLIVLNSDEDASCQKYCGANGSFSNSHFPTTLKAKTPLSDEALDCIGIASEECKKLAEQNQ